MAFFWTANIIFTDEKGNKTRRTYKRATVGADLAVEASAVYADLAALVSAYEDVSDASVTATLSLLDDAVGGGAAAANSDVSDVAHVNLYLEPPPLEKLANIAIPAPVDALFIGGGAGTDLLITNADLIALVAMFESDWEISDGENVDTSVQDGIKDGEWRSRKYNPR